VIVTLQCPCPPPGAAAAVDSPSDGAVVAAADVELAVVDCPGLGAVSDDPESSSDPHAPSARVDTTSTATARLVTMPALYRPPPMVAAERFDRTAIGYTFRMMGGGMSLDALKR